MPDVIGASRTSDIPRLQEMDRTAAGIPASDGAAPSFSNGLNVAAGEPGIDTTAAGALLLGDNNATSIEFGAPILMDLATSRIRSTQAVAPSVGSGGAGISALSVVAGSTNIAGQVNATLTAVAAGVVIGVVAFNGAPLGTAPIAVICSLSGPTAGDAAPPDIGADTFTTSGFTLRSYGPTTVTTAAYVISYICIFA